MDLWLSLLLLLLLLLLLRNGLLILNPRSNVIDQ